MARTAITSKRVKLEKLRRNPTIPEQHSKNNITMGIRAPEMQERKSKITQKSRGPNLTKARNKQEHNARTKTLGMNRDTAARALEMLPRT